VALRLALLQENARAVQDDRGLGPVAAVDVLVLGDNYLLAVDDNALVPFLDLVVELEMGTVVDQLVDQILGAHEGVIDGAHLDGGLVLDRRPEHEPPDPSKAIDRQHR
jgi:hypothetical protein